MTQKFDIYQEVTDRIIAQMEKGIIPWQKPWGGVEDGAISYVSRKPYSMLNQMLLGEDGEYLTFNQITELGGKIKKGAKARMVVFFKWLEPKSAKEKTTEDKDEKPIVKIPFLQYYNVFHIKDTEGIESKVKENVQPKNNPIDEAERVIMDYVNREHLKFTQKPSDKAYYSPMSDEVVVPHLNQYKHVEQYYTTTFHELSHSTGAPTRLNRKHGMTSFFGGEDYSKEELVAEISASMLATNIGILTDKCFNNSVAYLQSWIRVLKNDKKMIVTAAGCAEKAAKYILGIN